MPWRTGVPQAPSDSTVGPTWACELTIPTLALAVQAALYMCIALVSCRGLVICLPCWTWRRGSEGRHDKELAQAVRATLERAAASPLQGPASAKRGGRKSPGSETWDPQWSALSAARAGLRGGLLFPDQRCL